MMDRDGGQRTRHWTGKPWQRQVGERDKSWAAFQVYLRLGEERTIRAVAKEIERAPSLVGRMAKRWAWSFRADQYDAIGARAEAQAVERTVKRHATARGKAMVKIADYTTASAVIAARRLFQRLRDDSKLALGVHATSELTDLALKLQRLPSTETTDDIMEQARSTGAWLVGEINRIRERMEAARARDLGLPTSPRQLADNDADDD